ncbi:unnamed protein product [Rhizoctonia solani]|uniref:Uncharacterized protein n=1 Tax=Rhizoctonia solani AG-3 Rhs1AP TaxID=1086054 RepID=A0A0A1UJL2_9AGAM|nr:hypothetical protein RSOL_307440 [Rhizoctonia solani AG-3 Rhs1AP]CAE6431807.1 unnamed protein product [Rhizoctonia solani]
MSYVSPFLKPEQYITNVGKLSSDGIMIDEAVARAVREARDYSNKHSSDFSLVKQLKDDLDKFEPRWTESLQASRNGASGLSARLNRFDEVFLSMINDVSSQQDANDVIAEFKAFLSEDRPSRSPKLEWTPGPKKAFEEIEGLVDQESNHVIEVMEDSEDWNKAIDELKQKLPEVQKGVKQVRGALEKYAVEIA